MQALGNAVGFMRNAELGKCFKTMVQYANDSAEAYNNLNMATRSLMQISKKKAMVARVARAAMKRAAAEKAKPAEQRGCWHLRR